MASASRPAIEGQRDFAYDASNPEPTAKATIETEATFTLTLDSELKDPFLGAAEKDDRSPSEIIQNMMQEYVADHALTPQYIAFLQAKVDISRKQIEQGLGHSNEGVQAYFNELSKNWK